MLVELKNGETLTGHLVNCDTWMNLTLKEVVQTSPEGDKFHRLPEVYVRGNNVCICTRGPTLEITSTELLLRFTEADMTFSDQIPQSSRRDS